MQASTLMSSSSCSRAWITRPKSLELFSTTPMTAGSTSAAATGAEETAHEIDKLARR